MQATSSATANPLIRQSSTTGASFWSVLASTTDPATPAGQSVAKAQSATEQPSNTTASTGTLATSEESVDTAAAGETTGNALAQMGAQPRAKAAAASAALAQTVSDSTPAAGAAQRRTSDTGKSNGNDSASSASSTSGAATAATAAGTVILAAAQLQTPVPPPVTVDSTTAAAAAQNAPAGTDSRSTSAAISSRTAVALATAGFAPGTNGSVAAGRTEDVPAQGNAAPLHASSTAASAETANAQDNTKTAAAAKTLARAENAAVKTAASPAQQPSDAAAQAGGSKAVPAANAGPGAGNAKAQNEQPSNAAPAASPQTNGTDAKPQTAAAKNAIAATAISVALPRITTEQPAAATTAVISSFPPVSLASQFSAVASDASGSVKAGQSAVSSTPSASASASASSDRSATTAAAPDKSHTAASGDSQNSSAGPIAGVTPQHASDAAQAVTVKAADTGAATLQSVAHGAASSQPIADRAADTARSSETPRMPLPAAADTEPTAASGVNAAHLIQTMGQTGMQVGMHSAEFGDISIRTLVSQQQMTAQISVDHGDLGRAIAAHVPGVQTRLGNDFGMHASIQVNQGGASFTSDQGSSSGGQQKTYGRPVQMGSTAMAQESDSTGLAISAGESDRLDIRA